MPKQVRLRRGTTAQHATFTGADGEVTFDTDRKCLVVHDGVTAGGRPVHGYVRLDPGDAYVEQVVTSCLKITGGDFETYGLRVMESAAFEGNTFLNGVARSKALSPYVVSLNYAATVNLDFAAGRLFCVSQLTGNLTLSHSNNYYGDHALVRLVGDAAVTRNLTFPGNWRFVGAAAPATLAANKAALLELWSVMDPMVGGPLLARYTVEP